MGGGGGRGGAGGGGGSGSGSGGADPDDGVFWMAWSDFCDYFHHVDICRVRPEWAEVRARGSLARGMPGGGGGSGGGGGVLAAHELTVLETTEVDHGSLLIPDHALLYSLLATHYSLLTTTHYSLPTAHHALLHKPTPSPRDHVSTLPLPRWSSPS